jgi:hypothetical protein
MYTAILTGSRKYPDWCKVNTVMDQLYSDCKSSLFVRVGDCPTGLDNWVDIWCDNWLVDHKVYTANWHKHGLAAGPIRNSEMVGADICIAFPDDDSKGTKDCAFKANAAGIPVFFPDLPAWSHWAIPLIVL